MARSALAAALPLLLVIAPAVMWARYLKHPPGSRRRQVTWAVLAVAVLLAYAVSPLAQVSVLAFGIVVSEIARGLSGPAPAVETPAASCSDPRKAVA